MASELDVVFVGHRLVSRVNQRLVDVSLLKKWDVDKIETFTEWDWKQLNDLARLERLRSLVAPVQWEFDSHAEDFWTLQQIANQRRKKYNLRFHRTKPCDKFIAVDFYKFDSHYYARYNSKPVATSSVSSQLDIKQYSITELTSYRDYASLKTKHLTQHLMQQQIQMLEQSTVHSSVHHRLDKFMRDQADAIKRKAKLPSLKFVFPQWVPREKIAVLKSNRIHCRKDYHRWMLLHHPDKCSHPDLQLVQRVTDAVAACKWK